MKEKSVNLTRRHMDIIYLNQLQVETVIGIHEWERRIRQPVLIDLEMGWDIARAAQTDSISDTLDYKAIAKRLIAFAEASDCQLVETLAWRMTDLLISEFKLPWLRLRINKRGAVSHARDVGVLIERGSRE